MDEQVFADGIGTISMIGGTVRLDFLAYSPTETDPTGQPKPVFRQRIIMGLEAFLASAEKIHEAAQALAARSARPEPAARSEVVHPEPTRPETARPEPIVRPTLVPTEPPPEPAPAKPPVKPPFP